MKRIQCFYGGTIAPKAITGGDRHGLEVWSSWSARGDCTLTVHASYWGKDLIREFGYDLDVARTETSPSSVGASRVGYFTRFLHAFRASFRAGSADTVYSASPYFYDLLPSIALKVRTHAGLIVALFHLIPPPWERTGSPLINTVAWIEQRMMVWLVKTFADRVVVDNRELVSDLRAMGIPSDRIVLSTMGIRPLPGRVDGASNAGAFDAIYVGRLSGPKGVPGLISAWKYVVQRLPNARLALVGNNEVAFDAERLVREQGLQNAITVISGLSDVEVREALLASRIFITGSLEEGYGLSVLEALSAGLPCVTFDIPAFREAFPVGRYPAESNDYDALARAAVELLSDERLQQSLRLRIQKEVLIRTWPEVAAELWSRCVD